MGLFNWKKNKKTTSDIDAEEIVNSTKKRISEEKPSFVEHDEMVKAVQDFLAEMDKETAKQQATVTNGEETRRKLPEVNEWFKRLQAMSVYTMAEIVDLDPFTIEILQIALLENGLGERYFNIMRDGVIDRNGSSYKLVMQSSYFQSTFMPWLEGRTDTIPRQTYADMAAMFKRLFEIQEQQERK